MNKRKNIGSYVVSRSKGGRNIEVRVVGFKRSVIIGFQEDMREIYETERSKNGLAKVTDFKKQ